MTKGTNNDNTTQRTADWVTRTPLKKLGCSGRVTNSCSTSGTVVTNRMVSSIWKVPDSDYNKWNISVVFCDTETDEGYSRNASLMSTFSLKQTRYYTIINFGIDCYLDLSIWKKSNIHRAAFEVNVHFLRLINQIATYSEVNNCFNSWKCFIVITVQSFRVQFLPPSRI